MDTEIDALFNDKEDDDEEESKGKKKTETFPKSY